jgi:PAS domain S-box-containing protein
MTRQPTNDELRNRLHQLEQENLALRLAVDEAAVRHRSILGSMHDAYLEVDLKGKITSFNDMAVRMLGYGPEELLSIDYRRFISPETAARIFKLFRSVYTTGEPASMVDYEAVHKDGSLRDHELSIWPIHDVAGQSVGFHVLVRDMTESKRSEKFLRESEERYRAIFENTGSASVLLDADTTILLANSNFEKLSGYTKSELEGKMSWTTFVHAHDLERMRQFHELRRNLPGSAPEAYEFRFKTRSGELREVFLTVVLIPGTDASVATCLDITDRKMAEQALRESEGLYRTIFENTATANIITAQDTTILLANSNFEKVTGYSRHELEGSMSWTAFVVPEDLDKMREYHYKRRLEPEAPPHAYEFRAKMRSGEIKDFFMSVALIPGTQNSIASLIDISERKKVEEALRQNEERFRDMAQFLPESVFEVDLQGRFTYVNQVSLERFGYSHDDLERDLNFMDIIAPPDQERAIANVGRILNGERIGLNEYLVIRKDGTTFPALAHTVQIIRDGRSEGLRGFLVDITEKKQIEEQLLRAQKMEAIGTLAGGIAHDFNNLLMGILGNISLMLMQVDESHAFYERLRFIEQYVKRGSDLTKQLLGFARGGKYEVKPTDLKEFVRQSTEMFGRTKKEIRIKYKAPESLWPVEVDRGQMEQVLLNLFLNAWQAMPGGGDLYLALANDILDEETAFSLGLKPGRFVKLMVTDTGMGMDDATKARIFEPFFSTKGRARGTGLGLASAYGIIKHHGGCITVESEVDIGTTFSIYLPATDKEVHREAELPDTLLAGHETVLLIDDEEMIIEVGQNMLTGLGYTVLTARSGQEGLRIYDRNKGQIDIVILDMIMPDFGGKETFEALLRQDPGVKVLLSSGYSIDGQAKKILVAGCKGFIQKPFGIVDLSVRLREILDQP